MHIFRSNLTRKVPGFVSHKYGSICRFMSCVTTKRIVLIIFDTYSTASTCSARVGVPRPLVSGRLAIFAGTSRGRTVRRGPSFLRRRRFHRHRYTIQ